MDLVDLAVRRFEHGGDLGDLGSLWEPSELVGSYSQVSAWSFVDVVTVDTEKIFVKVAMERPSLQVELVVMRGLGHRKGALVFTALRVVDVPVFTSGAFLIGFVVLRGAVDADVEDCTTLKRWERGLLGEGFSEGLRGALRFRVRTFLQDGLEGCFGASAGVQHVDHRRELVGDLVGERMDILHLVGEFAPQGILVCSGGVGEPKRQGHNPRSVPSSFR